MCIQMKYSRLVMKYSVSLEFLSVTLPIEMLSGREAGCFNEPLGNHSPLNSAYLFSCLFFFSAVDFHSRMIDQILN